jgi:hypothetical protein
LHKCDIKEIIIIIIIIRLCHSLCCNGKIWQKRELRHLWDYILTTKELKTGWLFTLHPCHQSQSMDSFRFPYGDPDHDWITGRKERATVGPKLKYYPGIWISEGPLYLFFFTLILLQSVIRVWCIHRLVRWVISFATSCMVLKLYVVINIGKIFNFYYQRSPPIVL